MLESKWYRHALTSPCAMLCFRDRGGWQLDKVESKLRTGLQQQGDFNSMDRIRPEVILKNEGYYVE